MNATEIHRKYSLGLQDLASLIKDLKRYITQAVRAQESAKDAAYEIYDILDEIIKDEDVSIEVADMLHPTLRLAQDAMNACEDAFDLLGQVEDATNKNKL
jgi:hypothetical protein